METSQSFIHTPAARIIAAVFGIGCFATLFTVWGEDINQEIKSFTDGKPAELVAPINVERVQEENPALQACLEERLGHVTQMIADGVITEKQGESFSARARALCIEQNQS
ncbi:MAG: hypothetical protein AAGE89_02845 [Pseudomonadota bacterium]